MPFSSVTRIAAVLLGALALVGCADVAVVDPGHRAVVLTPSGQFLTLSEGASSVPTDSQVDDFDLRQQATGGTFVAVTADGVPLTVADPIVSYTIDPQQVVDLDRHLGADRIRQVVAPLVSSAIATVLATYRWDEMDTPHLRQAQERITALARQRLGTYHLALTSVELKGVFPKLPGLAEAVNATSVAEQQAARAATLVQIAKQEADRRREEAQGIAAANDHVAPTLTAAVLDDKANRAWQQLLTASSTTVVVAGDAPTSLEVSP